MKQLILSQIKDVTDKTATEYTPFAGGDNWQPDIETESQLATTPGTLSSFKVEMSQAPANGSYTFKLINRTQAIELSVTITDAELTGEDLGSIDVAQGDLIVIESSVADTPDNTAFVRFSCIFEGDNANESIIPAVWNCNAFVANAYTQLNSGQSGSAATEVWYTSVISTPGIIKNMMVNLVADYGTDPEGFNFTLRVNGADTPLTCGVVAEDLTAEDLVNEVAVVAGDIVDIKITAVSTPNNSTVARAGVTFVATTDGESLWLGGLSNALNNGVIEHNYLNRGQQDNWAASTAGFLGLAQVVTIRNLYVDLINAPGAGKSFAFTVDVEGVSRLTATVADAAKTADSGATEFECSDFDTLILKCAPTGTPTTGQARWGATCFIASASVRGWAQK